MQGVFWSGGAALSAGHASCTAEPLVSPQPGSPARRGCRRSGAGRAASTHRSRAGAGGGRDHRVDRLFSATELEHELARIDPPGFALEEFNAIGGAREWYRSLGKKGKRVGKTRYRRGPDVDPSGEFADGRRFAGFAEFRRHLAARPDTVARAIAEKLLIYGALLIFMMLQRPEGLVPNVRRSRELHLDEFLQDAWLREQVDEDDAHPEGAGESGPEGATA